ncbi:hypothetical protein COY07_04735 [Candidatus Peregrinibacteria bacterium CG_4_10_14_0_2_um_filter_43_11]|nr:MAG: hypothetical protein COY07_04735 [Candidatus Peregrinibacteria bacterium CG_4_10_14_0_2_um_filter_43_11]
MASYDQQTGEPTEVNKDYTAIIQSDVEVDQKFIEDTGIPAKIVYYCDECKALTQPKRIGNKFRFSCAKCKSDRVSFGTEAAVGNYYRIPGFKSREDPNKKELRIPTI